MSLWCRLLESPSNQKPKLLLCRVHILRTSDIICLEIASNLCAYEHGSGVEEVCLNFL